jgi:LacI family transcriptional regulator
MAALAEAGIAIDPTLLVPGNFTQVGGEQAARRILQIPTQNRPTAIFAANDETAFGILTTLYRQGWHIPKDISLCGFGDLPMAQMIIPSLTTVRIGLRELGRRGARKMFALLQKTDGPIIETQPTTLVIRETIATPSTSEQ